MVETCPPLAPLGLAYGLAMRVRNWLYDHGTFTAHRVGVPVVSVGNLSVGGTGKTPLVIWLVERARAAGKRPGVLARGYGREDGRELNDEGIPTAHGGAQWWPSTVRSIVLAEGVAA